jgi:adenine deaminase
MHISVETLRKRISAAKGEISADLVLRGASVVNVFSGEIQEKDVAVYDEIIVGLGSDLHGKEEVDIRSKWIVPGLIDGHIHVESSMLLPSKLAAALLVHGTTTIVSDPHEIANVKGLSGVHFMLRESSEIPFDIFYMAPSCVPATHLETSGATLKASDLSELKDEPRILGLAEMMNFPGVLMGDQGVLEKIVLFRNQILDGHCPFLRGHDLQAYLTTGIHSDHETTDRSEGLEKVENGMMLMIREGTSAKNLEELLPLVNSKNSRRFCFVSDDLHAEDIQQRGHLNFIVRKAIQLGLDPATAVQLVTINPAEYFGLKDRGAVAPGYRADFVVLDDLETFKVASVYKNGRIAVDRGALVNFPMKQDEAQLMQSKPLNIAPLTPENFCIPYSGGKARVIELVSGQIVTKALYEEVKSTNGFVTSDIESDILKLCVVERHQASGQIGLGLVKGFGLKRGAVASSVAHDSHNVIVVGQPIKALVKQLRRVKKAASNLGCVLEEPFMALSFLALPVIPELKLTDMGLVDVNHFEIVPLFIND